MIKRRAALGRDRALALDAHDPLASFRERFEIADPALVYLDGNSLGCLPIATRGRLSDVVTRWGERIVEGWEDGWLDLPLQVGDRLGAAALGAAAGQVALADSTTVCFYKLVAAALDARPERTEIVTDVDNFPTDRYVLEGLAAARGVTIRQLAFDPRRRPDGGRCRRRSHRQHRSRHVFARLLPIGPHRRGRRDQRACPRRRRVDTLGPES